MSHAAADTPAQHVSAVCRLLLSQLLLVAGPGAAVLPVIKREGWVSFGELPSNHT